MRPHETSLRGIPCNPIETPGMKRQSRVNASNWIKMRNPLIMFVE